MQNREYDTCFICREPIKKGYLTEGKDGNHYCAKCLIDFNKKIEIKSIMLRRKNELIRELAELEFELGENKTIDVMYHEVRRKKHETKKIYGDAFNIEERFC